MEQKTKHQGNMNKCVKIELQKCQKKFAPRCEKSCLKTLNKAVLHNYIIENIYLNKTAQIIKKIVVAEEIGD